MNPARLICIKILVPSGMTGRKGVPYVEQSRSKIEPLTNDNETPGDWPLGPRERKSKGRRKKVALRLANGNLQSDVSLKGKGGGL